jgi:hypothetical protein
MAVSKVVGLVAPEIPKAPRTVDENDTHLAYLLR